MSVIVEIVKIIIKALDYKFELISTEFNAKKQPNPRGLIENSPEQDYHRQSLGVENAYAAAISQLQSQADGLGYSNRYIDFIKDVESSLKPFGIIVNKINDSQYSLTRPGIMKGIVITEGSIQ